MPVDQLESTVIIRTFAEYTDASADYDSHVGCELTSPAVFLGSSKLIQHKPKSHHHKDRFYRLNLLEVLYYSSATSSHLPETERNVRARVATNNAINIPKLVKSNHFLHFGTLNL
jgi:hypothetical protein